MELKLTNLYDNFRDANTIKALAKLIARESKGLNRTLNIMEVCGGHTHTIMKYGLPQILPQSINFIHGPGCPVCIMPKERIDHAYILAMEENTILVTLGDMIKVPGSYGSLQKARAKGADVRFVYSPIDTLKIAKENPQKQIIFFAIGFETTTPMTAILLEQTIKEGVDNILFHINHVTVPEVMEELLSDGECQVNAFLGPAHVSVITGSRIYNVFPKKYFRPVVVSGFEPVDVMESILKIVRQFREGRCEVEIQYRRAVTENGNLQAQNLIQKYFEKVSLFRWRGLGDIPQSGWRLKSEFDKYNAEVHYQNTLPNRKIDDHKLCICGDILKGIAKPYDCSIFGKGCKPNSPVGSCMVSSEGACSAYYKYGTLLK